MDKIGHCVTCLKIETYMSGKNAETFSLIRFGVFIKSPKRFFKSPKPSGNPAGIVRSLKANYAVVEAGSCGRFFALTSQCEGIERSIPEALRKALGLLKKCRNVFKKDFGV